MSITAQRVAELRQLYDQLKEQCRSIDDKYSLSVVQPDLDMPPSLNLEKLQFVPKSQEELRALAQQQVAPYVLSRQRTIQTTYNNALQKLADERNQRYASNLARQKEIEADYEEQKAALKRKIINHGLVFSNVMEKYKDDLEKKTQALVQEENQLLQSRIEDIARREQNAADAYEQSCEALQTEQTAREVAAYDKLAAQQEKDRIAVEKYNNSLEEKEQKYLASRARAYESALRAATNRALDNAKIYSELGETGYRELISREKYTVSKTAFADLRREEGLAILSFDSFLRNNLGVYYDSFVDWVSTALLV